MEFTQGTFWFLIVVYDLYLVRYLVKYIAFVLMHVGYALLNVRPY
jgi:hypothetical protein